MKKIFLLLLLPLLSFDAGDKFLSKIDLYQKDSFYKTEVYQQHTWQSFSKLADANKTVEPNNYDLHLLNAAVFFATNKMREEKKVPPLKFSAPLRDAATIHTWEMVEKKFFDHFNSRSPKLHSPEDRIKLFEPVNMAIAENIDMNNIPMPSKSSYWDVALKIVDDFYHSTPHRKNMLNKTYTAVGTSAVFEGKDKNGVRYVKATQDFAAN